MLNVRFWLFHLFFRFKSVPSGKLLDRYRGSGSLFHKKAFKQIWFLYSAKNVFHELAYVLIGAQSKKTILLMIVQFS